jgi:DNA-binding CsgD family transcriptional regulator
MMTTKNHVAPAPFHARGPEAQVNEPALFALSKSRAPVLAIDARGHIVSWNAACERLLGMPTEDARGKTCKEVLSLVNGDTERSFVPPRAGVPMESFEVHAQTATGMRRLAMIPVPIDPEAHGAAAAWAYVIYPLPPSLSDEELRQSRQELGLTQRELEVVELLAQGKSTEDIAADLAIARTTARNHIQSILQKLGVHSRLEAVAHLRRHGVV